MNNAELVERLKRLELIVGKVQMALKALTVALDTDESVDKRLDEVVRLLEEE